MAKLIIETDLDNSGLIDGLVDTEKIVGDFEKKIGQKLHSSQKKNIETIVNEVTKMTMELSDKISNYKDLMSSAVIFSGDKKEAEGLKKEIIDITKKLEKLTGEKITIKGITETKNAFKDIGKNLKDTIKKVTMWGLALFGIRSIYGFISNAVSRISSQDEQLSANIDYMKNALAYTLEPLVRRIVEWAKQLMFYIGYIIKMWTGKNIFENANKSLQKADKSAKSLQKTLAGFDEMNVLNDNGSVGVAGAVSPDFDLSALNGVEIPGWIDWIAKNKEIVLGFIQGIIVGLTAFKGGWEGLKALGIGITIIAIVELIKQIIDFINDPSWSNFVGILDALADVLIGIGIAMIGFNSSNPVGWILIAIGVIGDFTAKLFEQKDITEKLTEAKDNLRDAEQNFIRAQNTQIDAIKRQSEAFEKLKKMQDETGESGEALYNAVLNGSTTYEQMTDNAKKTYLAYLDYKDATISAEKATEDLKNKEHEQAMSMLDVKAKTAEATGNFEELGETVNTLVKNGKITAKDASMILNQTYKDIDKEGRKAFHEQLPQYFDESTEAGKQLERELENIYRQYDRVWKRSNGGRGYLQYDPNMYNAKGGIVYAKGGIVPTIKLASGAIINRPGAGVPIGGERAPEGVIPLTDSQQMSLLGKAIGQNANIYVTTPVYVGNRLVAREMKRIEAEDNFAFNR